MEPLADVTWSNKSPNTVNWTPEQAIPAEKSIIGIEANIEDPDIITNLSFILASNPGSRQ